MSTDLKLDARATRLGLSLLESMVAWYIAVAYLLEEVSFPSFGSEIHSTWSWFVPVAFLSLLVVFHWGWEWSTDATNERAERDTGLIEAELYSSKAVGRSLALSTLVCLGILLALALSASGGQPQGDEAGLGFLLGIPALAGTALFAPLLILTVIVRSAFLVAFSITSRSDGESGLA